MRPLLLSTLLFMTALAGCSDDSGSGSDALEGMGGSGDSGGSGGFGGACSVFGDDGYWSMGCTPGSYSFERTFSCPDGDTVTWSLTASDESTFTGSAELRGPGGQVVASDSSVDGSMSLYLADAAAGSYTAKGTFTVTGEAAAGYFGC